MKKFILILIAGILLNYANAVKFEEEDVYDDEEDVEERSYDEPEEESLERPTYDINDAPDLFQKFLKDYNKMYKTKEEYKKRYGYFLDNLKEIIRLNEQGGSSAWGINMFSDYSSDEFASRLG